MLRRASAEQLGGTSASTIVGHRRDRLRPAHRRALHAATDGIINEIIAHATAAVYFDREVDTIFEIGGQDAKYTYLIERRGLATTR